jgi:hypothetical protein
MSQPAIELWPPWEASPSKELLEQRINIYSEHLQGFPQCMWLHEYRT